MQKFLLPFLLLIIPLSGFGANDSVNQKSKIQIEYGYSGTYSFQSLKKITLNLAGNTSQIPAEVKKGLIGMKIGESRDIVVTGSLIPLEFGSLGSKLESRWENVAPISYGKVPKKYFNDIYISTGTYSDFTENVIKCEENTCGGVDIPANSIRVGSIVSAMNPTGFWNMKGKVTSIKSGIITVEYKNIDSPFYGLKKEKGTKGTDSSHNWEIYGFDEENYFIAREWKKSPFYKKEFRVGAIAKTPQGIYIQVLKIDSETGKVTVQYSETNPETIVYRVKILKIQ